MGLRRAAVWDDHALRRDAPLDDGAMTQHARALAAALRVDGRRRLDISLADPRRIGRLVDACDALNISEGARTPALEWFEDNAHLVRADMCALIKERGGKLCAVGRRPRIQILMREMVAHSDAQISRDRLIGVIAAFDEVQPLKMEEIWAAPSALRVELLGAFALISQQVVLAQRERKRAEDWVNAGAHIDEIARLRPGAAFLERALQLMHEQEMPAARRALEEYLERHEEGAEAVTRRAHAQQSVDQLWLGNIMAALRMLAALDWQACFRSLSRAEAALMEDPSGTYPKMDESSRESVRREVAQIALQCGLNETMLVRHALSCAREGGGLRAQVCWWLYDDQGRRALMEDMHIARVRPGRIVPDPSGARLICGIAVAGALLLALIARLAGWAAALAALPLAWGAAAMLVNRALSARIGVRRLLKLKIERVADDQRTLIAVPALLSSPERVDEAVNQLETLGQGAQDENIDLLLLGDFRDGALRDQPEDEAILERARAAIARLNARAGRERYFYLHRRRAYAPVQDGYMGHERKRGALMALCHLALGGESAFDAEDACAAKLRGRYQYLVTLDVGTMALPGAIKGLIGAMAHPLNRYREEDGAKRGYAILQPRVEIAYLDRPTRFARLMGGPGGVDSYPCCAPGVYQALCGRGLFGGKGIIDIKAFYSSLKGRLPDGAVLSHDLLEGLLSGAGNVGDIALYDGFPSTPRGYLSRLNRWTRGDWQLLAFLFGRLPLNALGRYLILDNLRRSLVPAATLSLILGGLWSGNAAALAVALIYAILPALSALPRLDARAFAESLCRLAVLPAECFETLDAVARTLYRLCYSHRNLLCWVTAADADRGGGGEIALCGRVASILLLGTLAQPPFIPLALLFAALFLGAEAYLSPGPAPAKALSDGQVKTLDALARDTWRYFEEQVSEQSAGLPPDNVQINPPAGVARRTSPTNIGLYLTACLAACQLDIIDCARMLERMERTTDTLERMEKWHGQLYNWYGIDKVEPLRPRYVSSVDSGNLAACLMAVSAALERQNSPRAAALSARMENLAHAMDFSALYDAQRNLFSIGMDVEHGKLSQSHYDLLASESRILSFVAIALGQAPVKHWWRLGRALSGVPGGAALRSWSGTMFEYLMPELFMRAGAGSLLGVTAREVIRRQAARPSSQGVWGVSESGYNAFDLMMNYQYRAFGLPELSMRGGGFEPVYAPYAAILALPLDPERVMRNIERMKALGLTGRYGPYEAVDYSPARLGEGEERGVIESFMAHHQGMILCALLNALRGDFLVKCFMGRSDTRALALLLNERAPGRAWRSRRGFECRRAGAPRAKTRTARAGRADLSPCDTHLLYGGGGTRLVSADGQGFLRINGVMVNRFQTDDLSGGDNLAVHVRLNGTARGFLAGGQLMGADAPSQRVIFDAGRAAWTTHMGGLECRMTECVSPEDGALVQHLTFTNHASRAIQAEVTGCFKVALAAQSDIEAHPAFQNLFVESARAGESALVFRRRPRGADSSRAILVHTLFGAQGEPVGVESDLYRLVGRDGGINRPGGIARRLSGTVGRVLDPCSALRVSFTLAPGESRQMGFAIGIVSGEEEAKQLIMRYGAQNAARRAQTLAGTQARAMLDFLGLTSAQHHLLQRAAAFLCFAQYHFAQESSECALSISTLWALGISGDLPIIAVFVRSAQQLGLAREAIRAHEFYRSMGVWCDLALVNDYGNDYEQPVRDALREMVCSSHLRELQSEPGGAYILEGATLTEPQRALLRAAAALLFDGEAGPLAAQLLRRLNMAVPVQAAARHMALKARPHREKAAPPNGWGNFSQDGSAYLIRLDRDRPTPAPWSNILAGAQFGTLITERAGGFTWHGNSRSGRLTPFLNNPLREGWGETLTLYEDGRALPLLPGPDLPLHGFEVEHRAGESRFCASAGDFEWTVSVFVDARECIKCLLLTLDNRAARARRVRVDFCVNFLMGALPSDRRYTRVSRMGGALTVARGVMPGVGFAYAPSNEFTIAPGGRVQAEFLLGWAESVASAREALSAWQRDGAQTRRERALEAWEGRLARLSVETPDRLLNAMLNRFLPYQAIAGRMLARTGLYQGGGAYGFRDQLQDALCMLPLDAPMAREHILLCAAHQFEEGDVQHWWHPERTGVRTRISDDMLFLPYVTAQYVRESGDEAVLEEQAPFLRLRELAPEEEDLYAEPEITPYTASVREHCLRAIRRCARLGAHGLPLMGSGDWNDGMNRVGAKGKGESVWLGEFLKVACEQFAPLCVHDDERSELTALAARLGEALEREAWDGKWYRRAFFDDGRALGSAAAPPGEGCRIDAITQSWAAAAALDPPRVKRAMDSVWKYLVDPDARIIRLLTPAFDGAGPDAGYITGYPPGVRENGGQYTHAACWVVMAYALLGQSERAWSCYEMLLPFNHARTRAQAELYRVEPYVMAGDVYGEPPHTGRGGWTWYTGAAGWMYRVGLKYLLGYERRGELAKLNALLPEKWNEVSVRVQVGGASYTLISRRGERGVSLDGAPVTGEYIALRDDGQAHRACFPARA